MTDSLYMTVERHTMWSVYEDSLERALVAGRFLIWAVYQRLDARGYTVLPAVDGQCVEVTSRPPLPYQLYHDAITWAEGEASADESPDPSQYGLPPVREGFQAQAPRERYLAVFE